MPNKASIFYRLGNGDEELARERLEMIERQVKASNLAEGVAFVKREWDIDTSDNALSRELIKLRDYRDTEAMMDRLERRRERTKKLRQITEQNGPALSPENLQTIDQHISDFLAALDCEQDDAKRAKIEERFERWTKIFATLAKAADASATTRLNVQKFQFDAVKAVLANADLVRELSGSAISDDEKTQQLGQAIFGKEWA